MAGELRTSTLHYRAAKGRFARFVPSKERVDEIFAQGKEISPGHMVWEGLSWPNGVLEVFMAVRGRWNPTRNQDRLIEWGGSYSYEAIHSRYTIWLEDYDEHGSHLGTNRRTVQRWFPIGARVEGFAGKDDTYILGTVVGHGPVRVKVRLEDNPGTTWSIGYPTMYSEFERIGG